MKSGKTVEIILYCSAAAFYICALLNIFSSETRSQGVVWFCSGTTFLCLGIYMRNRRKNGDDKKDNSEDK